MKSIKPREQRKMMFNAPLHKKRKWIASHLSENLLLKYDRRSVPVVKGDTVKVMRGSFKGHEDKVAHINIRKQVVEIEGLTTAKADGTKIAKPIHASNLLITKLNLTDKWRRRKLETGLSETTKKEIEKEAEEQIKEIEEEERIAEEKVIEEAEEIPEEKEETAEESEIVRETPLKPEKKTKKPKDKPKSKTDIKEDKTKTEKKPSEKKARSTHKKTSKKPGKTIKKKEADKK